MVFAICIISAVSTGLFEHRPSDLSEEPDPWLDPQNNFATGPEEDHETWAALPLGGEDIDEERQQLLGEEPEPCC